MHKWHPSSGESGGRSRRGLIVAAVVAAAVTMIGGAAAAVALPAMHHNRNPATVTGSLARASATSATSNTPPFVAVANVTPPVAATACITPATFTFSGTVSAAAAGTVKYQWVYGSGEPGPVQTLSFAAAGNKTVAGATVKAAAADGGWGEIKLLSPVVRMSGRASYRRLCGGTSAGGLTATATVTPAAKTAACAPAPPAFTATGEIRASKAEKVTYYWAQSSGVKSAPATLVFTGPGTLRTAPLTITPAAASGAGEAVLVVTSPVTTASAPATYTLTCSATAAAPTGNPTAARSAPAAGPTSPTGPASPASPASPTSRGGQLLISPYAGFARAQAGDTYMSAVTVSGGTAPYAWGAVKGLPPGLTASRTEDPSDAALTISGTPTVPGDYGVTLSVTDSSSPARAATVTLPVSVAAAPSLVAIVDAPARAGFGQPYSSTVTASGGAGPFTWSPVTNLPPGLTVTTSGATLTISGSPTQFGDFGVSGAVSDGESIPKNAVWLFHVTVVPPPITITTNARSEATVGQPYSGTFTASGGTGEPFKWTVTVPPWLTATVNGATVTVTGTPTQYDLPASVRPETGIATIGLLVTAPGSSAAGREFGMTIFPAS